MTTVSIPVGSQPFIKTANRPHIKTAGAAIAAMDPIYQKTSDGLAYTADSDPTDTETNVVIGIALSKAETGSQVMYASVTGTIIDFGGTLTAGDTIFLDGSAMATAYSDVSSLDYLTRLGYVNETGDFVVNIVVQGEVK